MGTASARVATRAPPGLAEFEAFVVAETAPAVVIIDRALIRALLAYVRQLERDADLTKCRSS